MAKKSRTYWQKRFQMLEEAQNRDSKQLNAYLEKEYREAEKEIEAAISLWYTRFADNNEINTAEARKWLKGKDLEEFKWDVNEYIKYGRENAINQQWMKELENASAKFHISRLESLKIRLQHISEVLFADQEKRIEEHIQDVFTNDYYYVAYEIQKGFSIGWDIESVDTSRLKKIISKPWLADGKTFSDRIWTNKQGLIDELHKQLTHTVMLGEPP